MAVDPELIYQKLATCWDMIGQMKLEQLLLLALIIYCMPFIIRICFELSATAIKAIIQMYVFYFVVSIVIDVFTGNYSDLTIHSVTDHLGKFLRKLLKPFIGKGEAEAYGN